MNTVFKQGHMAAAKFDADMHDGINPYEQGTYQFNECKRDQLVANVEQCTKAYQSSIIDEMFEDAYHANINLANALKALNDFDNNKK